MTAGEVFAALADPTRRQLVDWLAGGESGTATEFAARLPISRQAVARHLSELSTVGLVVATKKGKELRYSLDARPLTDAMHWLEVRAAQWDSRLEALVRHLDDD